MYSDLIRNRISQQCRSSIWAILCSIVILAQLNWQPVLLAQQKVTFVQITDTHISENPETHRVFERILSDVNQLIDEPAFVLNTGDLTEFGSAAEFKYYRDIVDRSGLTCYHALGNHDVRWCNTGKKEFLKWLGPLYQSFEHGGIQFIILDSGLLLEQYGHFSKQQLSWLRQELKNIGTEKPIILAAHHPIFLEKKYVDNEFELLKLLDSYNVVLFVCGHGHQNQHWQINGIHFLMTKAVKSASPGYRIFKTHRDSIWIYNRDLNDQTTALDFSCALTRTRNMPKFTIDEPTSKSIFNNHLPITIRSKEISQIRVSLDGISWQALRFDQDKFKADLDIEHFSPGNYFLRLKFFSNESQLWLYQVPIQVEQNKIMLVSKFETNDAILASPVITGGMLLIGSLDGNLYALDAETMNLNWRFQTDGPIVTAPVVQLDTIFVTSGDGFCYALNKKDGKPIWKTKAGEAIFSSPVYADGTIIFGSSDSSLHGLRSSDGKSRWKFKTAGYIKARPALYDDRVCFGSWDGSFYCIAREDGRLIWKTQISNNRYFPAATSNPLEIQDKVIVSSHDHIVHAFQVSNGDLFWQHQANERNKPGYSSPVCSDNTIYFGSLTGHLFALNEQSGTEIWSVALPDSLNPDPIFDSSPVIAETDVIVGSINGVVYGVDKNTGRQQWSVKLSDNYIFSSPVIWKKYVYIGSCDGAIYKVKISK